jgi:hypothetical protein
MKRRRPNSVAAVVAIHVAITCIATPIVAASILLLLATTRLVVLAILTVWIYPIFIAFYTIVGVVCASCSLTIVSRLTAIKKPVACVLPSIGSFCILTAGAWIGFRYIATTPGEDWVVQFCRLFEFPSNLPFIIPVWYGVVCVLFSFLTWLRFLKMKPYEPMHRGFPVVGIPPNVNRE